MIKWKLMLTTVPFMLAAVALKLVLDLGFQLSGWLEMGDVGPVLTGGVFLIGFMLAGTIADYKESEKLPGEVACTLAAATAGAVGLALPPPGKQAGRLDLSKRPPGRGDAQRPRVPTSWWIGRPAVAGATVREDRLLTTELGGGAIHGGRGT